MDGDLLRSGWSWFRFQKIGPSEEIPKVVLDGPRTVCVICVMLCYCHEKITC